MRSSQQIHAEFGSLCLASGKVAIPTELVDSFLDVFFPHSFGSGPRVISSSTDLTSDWLESQNWSSGLLKLVTIMHRHSLLRISWFKDITTIISILEGMNFRKFKSITSIEYDICPFFTNRQNCFLPRLGAVLWVKIKAAVWDSLRLGFSREHGVINVRFTLDGSSNSEEETSENSSGDENVSESEEDSSDDEDDDEDGDEDAPESSEGTVESSD